MLVGSYLLSVAHSRRRRLRVRIHEEGSAGVRTFRRSFQALSLLRVASHSPRRPADSHPAPVHSFDDEDTN